LKARREFGHPGVDDVRLYFESVPMRHFRTLRHVSSRGPTITVFGACAPPPVLSRARPSSTSPSGPGPRFARIPSLLLEEREIVPGAAPVAGQWAGPVKEASECQTRVARTGG
jgi:hypothetical protein